MHQGNELFNYIETAGDSSRRSRWVLLVMITTCILIFAAILNSRKDNWIDTRIEVFRYVYNNFETLKSMKPEDCVDKNSLEYRAVICIKYYKIEKEYDAECLLKGYINSKLNYIQIIRVPFFSFTFDINDLGFLSGFSLVFIMLFLRFCLWREYTNIKEVFEKAKKDDECKDKCYTIMSMKQVLTIPPNDKIKKKGLWDFLLKFIFFIPLIVHIIVTLNDFDTMEIGFIFSPSNMIFLLAANVIFCVLILLLTISCISISKDISNVWKTEKPEKTLNQGNTNTSSQNP